jgi:malate dehydrogenase
VVTLGQIDAIIEWKRETGSEIVKLPGKGGALYSPAAVVEMAETYNKDKKPVIPCAALCEGEFCIDDYSLEFPVSLAAAASKRSLSSIWLPKSRLSSIKYWQQFKNC